MDHTEDHNEFVRLRDSLPFYFWPIFFLSLRRLDAYRLRMMAEGYVGCDWKMTWYGYIYAARLYRADPLAVLKDMPTWEEAMVRSSQNLDAIPLFSEDTRENGYPVGVGLNPHQMQSSSRWIPACAGILGILGLRYGKLNLIPP